MATPQDTGRRRTHLGARGGQQRKDSLGHSGMFGQSETFHPEVKQILGGFLHGMKNLVKPIPSLHGRGENVDGRQEGALVTMGEGFTDQLQGDKATAPKRLDMRLGALLQVDDVWPGDFRISDVALAMSEEEFYLGEMLLLERKEKCCCIRTMYQGEEL